ncbi:MAG: hypothetical protein N2749_01990 [Clostridia bacterium]|nr:hypothetical protein [Clostridia bacterium]
MKKCKFCKEVVSELSVMVTITKHGTYDIETDKIYYIDEPGLNEEIYIYTCPLCGGQAEYINDIIEFI